MKLSIEVDRLGKELLAILDKEGYFPIYRVFRPGAYRPLELAAMRSQLSSRQVMLFDAFFLRQPVSRASLNEICGECIIDYLAESGIFARANTQDCIKSRLSLIEVQGYSYFFEPACNRDPLAYFGEDSIALLSYSDKAAYNVCVDFCAGPGIQSLILSRTSNKVYAIESGAQTYEILKVNIALNGLTDRIEPVLATVDGFVRDYDGKADHCVANPPLLPLPDSLAYSVVGHGGESGLSVTRSVLRMVDGKLSSRARIEVIGATLYNASGPDAKNEFLEWAHSKASSLTYLQLSRHRWDPASLFFNTLISDAATYSGRRKDEIVLELDNWLKSKNAIGLGTFFARFDCNGNVESSKFYDFSSIFRGLWFV